MTRRRGILAAVVAAAALVLSACTGLPTSGPVNYGLEPDGAEDSQEFFSLPDRPQPGATPEQIVEGFIRAGSGPGVAGNWARAKEFLAPGLQEVWDPTARVTVDVFADRAYAEPVEGVVELALDAVATVDDRGVYERVEVPEQPISFRLAQRDDGEWRITEAPDGIVLDRDQFPSVFHRYEVMYFDPSWTFLVPDVRWFPTTNAAASVVDALVNQAPADWLADSIANAFPENVRAVESVPVSSGVAEVDLSEEALAADALTLDRMLTQLEESLATAGVADVDLTVDSAPIAAEPVAVRSTRVSAPPLVLVEAGFGFLVGEDVERVPGISDAVDDVAPVSVQLGPDRDLAAGRLSTGEVVRLGADGSEAVLDTRPALVDPTIDPFGIVWSVPQDQPAALRAFLPGSPEPIEVADAWSGATQIVTMAISRDGTRMAAVVTSGGRSALWIAGVVRDPEQVPVRLGDPVQLATITGAGIGVAWIDDRSIAVLSGSADGSTVLEQVVGGPSSTTAAAPGMASIAGGTSISSVRLRASDGTLLVKRGTSWQPTATGVLVLGTQQGTPQ